MSSGQASLKHEAGQKESENKETDEGAFCSHQIPPRPIESSIHFLIPAGQANFSFSGSLGSSGLNGLFQRWQNIDKNELLATQETEMRSEQWTGFSSLALMREFWLTPPKELSRVLLHLVHSPPSQIAFLPEPSCLAGRTRVVKQYIWPSLVMSWQFNNNIQSFTASLLYLLYLLGI